MRKNLLLLVFLISSCSLSVSAGPITININAIGSGSLGGTAFTNAAIGITATGDTLDVVDFGAYLAIDPILATLTVTGFGPATFTSALAFVNPGAPWAGLAESSSTLVILAAADASFSSYFMESDIGPLSGGSIINPGSAYSTSAGSFVIDSITGETATYQATVTSAVPEPATLGFVGLGILALALAGYRRASQVSAWSGARLASATNPPMQVQVRGLGPRPPALVL